MNLCRDHRSWGRKHIDCENFYGCLKNCCANSVFHSGLYWSPSALYSIWPEPPYLVLCRNYIKNIRDWTRTCLTFPIILRSTFVCRLWSSASIIDTHFAARSLMCLCKIGHFSSPFKRFVNMSVEWRFRRVLAYIQLIRQGSGTIRETASKLHYSTLCRTRWGHPSKIRWDDNRRGCTRGLLQWKKRNQTVQLIRSYFARWVEKFVTSHNKTQFVDVVSALHRT